MDFPTWKSSEVSPAPFLLRVQDTVSESPAQILDLGKGVACQAPSLTAFYSRVTSNQSPQRVKLIN